MISLIASDTRPRDDSDDVEVPRTVVVWSDGLRPAKADPRLRLAQVIPSAVWWLDFPEQWGKAKSPWHDRRVRLAVNLAIDKKAINEAERLEFSRQPGSIIPSVMDFALRIEPHPFDPTHAKRLLADAGYPNG